MKQYLLCLLLLFISAFAFAQQENYYIKKNGERVNIYKNLDKPEMHVMGNNLEGQLHFTPSQVFYYNEKGKQKFISQKKVKELHFDGKDYINLPILKSKRPRLHEVIASNEKYILTSYFHNNYYLYIYDKQKMKPMEYKITHSKRKEADLELINNMISRYFSDCEELMAQLKENVEKANYKKRAEKKGKMYLFKNVLFNEISSLECK